MQISTDDEVVNNTFYNCTTGLSGDVLNVIVINNIFDENTTPINMTTNNLNNIFAYNNFDGDESSNVNAGNSFLNLDVDITLTDPTGNPPDFTLPDSSAVEGVANQINTNTGVTGDYNWNIGADQTDTQAGGSSAETTLILNGVAIN